MVDNAGDIDTDNVNEVSDTVQPGINHTLGINVENLSLIASAAINGSSSALDNIIIGNSNSLIGLAGKDSLDGGMDADTLIGGAGDDTRNDGVGEAVNDGSWWEAA